MITRHRVYWGSHGCKKPLGHSGPCKCECGQKLRAQNVFGDDETTAQRAEVKP